MGFREAYMAAKPTILEPIMRVEVQFPEEFQGAVMGQLNQRRGTIISSEKQEGFVQAMAEVPLNDMFGYSTDLRSRHPGQGRVHDGVPEVRRGPEAGARSDDRRVQGQEREVAGK